MSNSLIPYAGKEPTPSYTPPVPRPLFDQIDALQRQGLTIREAAIRLEWPHEFAEAVVLSWLYRAKRKVPA